MCPGQIAIEIKGVDVYDPTTGRIHGASSDDIAWRFIDTGSKGADGRGGCGIRSEPGGAGVTHQWHEWKLSLEAPVMLTSNAQRLLPVQLNLNVRGLKESATLAINERSEQRQRRGQKAYRLGLGQSPFPVPEAVVESPREHAAEKDYLPVIGPWSNRLRKRGIQTSEQLCERLFEDTGVAILPGSDFGRPPEELTARLAYVDFSGSHALSSAEAVPMNRDLDDHFLSLHCGKVLDAIEELIAWLR